MTTVHISPWGIDGLSKIELFYQFMMVNYTPHSEFVKYEDISVPFRAVYKSKALV